MPERSQHDDDDFTDADRRAIADIRRELDAEFGPLEPAAPLAAGRSPAAAAPRARPRSRARTAPLFLVGAVVGGAVGGVSGALTTLLWLQHLEEPPARVAARAVEGRAAVTDDPAAATREPLADSAALASALNEWLVATKTGDIDGQMRFYPARIAVYYTWRDVTRQAVREEKLRLFGAATRLEITTDTPTVEVTDDGASAVSRFRKRYLIEGPVVRRRGEVLQELRWARTPDGWRIVGERDVEVLTPGASVGPDRARRDGTIEPAR